MEKFVDLICMVLMVAFTLLLASLYKGGAVFPLSIGCLIFGSLAFFNSMTYDWHRLFFMVLVPAIIAAVLYAAAMWVALL